MYCVRSLGWDCDLVEERKAVYDNFRGKEEYNNFNFYCETEEQAWKEYNRLWEQELASDEGALIYDMSNDMILHIDD